MLRTRLVVGAGALLVTANLLAGSARAATDEEKAGARAAAVEGVRAFNEKRWADVVDMFNRAESLVHSPVHLLYIARANVQLGKLVLAREAYMRASRERVEPDSPPAFQRAADEAKEELGTIEPRVPYMTLKLEGAAPSAVTITMDGAKVPAALIGLARPVDPGEHKFEASGEGVSGAPVVIALAEGERKSATMVVQVSAVPQPAASPSTPLATDPGAAPPPGDQGGASAAPSANQSMRIASYAAFGVGAVGLGLGTVFGLKATSKRGEANDICKNGCPESKRDQIESLDNSANSANSLALVGFIVGGVGLASGATLFFLSAPKRSEAPPSTAFVRPWVGIGSAGVAGRF